MFQNEKEDSRIRNTKYYIYQALVELIEKYDYDDITISMIITKAGVGRSTYYRHFYDKEDIIISKLKIETLNILRIIKEKYDLTIYDKDIQGKIKFFFQYWDEHPEIIELIIKVNKTHLLLNLWTSSLIDLFSNADVAIASNSSEFYTAHFAIGGLTALLIQWFKNKRKDSIEFISKHFFIPQQ